MSEIVPFGKYKGQPVEVLANDRGYLDWLTAQAWFRERYAGIYTLIVNNFGEPTETPEHNALQARFLDEDFCRGLLAALKWQPVVDWPGHVVSRRCWSFEEKVLDLADALKWRRSDASLVAKHEEALRSLASAQEEARLEPVGERKIEKP
jgi:hypothetical protein